MSDINQPARADRINAAKIVAPHGVRGLVKVKLNLEDASIIQASSIFYEFATGDKTIPLTLMNSAGKYWLGKVEGIDDRSAAETVRGTEIWIDRSYLPELDNQNEFYAHDLVGLGVIDENGAMLGNVITIENFGAGDLLEVQEKDKDSFYIPFTKDIVKNVDTKQKQVQVCLPEGLL